MHTYPSNYSGCVKNNKKEQRKKPGWQLFLRDRERVATGERDIGTRDVPKLYFYLDGDDYMSTCFIIQ